MMKRKKVKMNMKMTMMNIFLISAVFLINISAAPIETNAEIRLKGKLSGGNTPPSSYNNNDYGSNYSVEPDRRILPRRGDIAVIVEGDNRQHVAIAETMIINELIDRGYRVVDEAKMKRIRMAAAKAKAAQYAWEGNIAGLLKLNGSYSVAATVLARVNAEYPRLNEYELYTGTSSVVLMAVSGPKRLGGRMSDAKSIGYSVEEAMRKSLYEAVRNGMQQFF